MFHALLLGLAHDSQATCFVMPDELAHNNADRKPQGEIDNWVIAIEAARETFLKGEREKGQNTRQNVECGRVDF